MNSPDTPVSQRPDAGRSGVRANVKTARQSLIEHRCQLQTRHAEGQPGIEICAAWARSIDAVVQSLFEDAVEACLPASSLLRSRISLVAHGGYGRRDMAPFSDVDLLLLYHATVRAELVPLAKRLVADLSDIGLVTALATRTTQEACQLAWKEPSIFTSQVEARYLGGSVSLFATFMQEFRRGTQRRASAIIHRIRLARADDLAHDGDTVFLLEPNVKRSSGALRDIHLLRWVGFARYLQWRPDHLERQGLLSPQDAQAIQDALGFLLRLRNELHFHAGRSQDVLRRQEQQRIAQLWDYSGTEGVLPVEHFMRDYFAHTGSIRHAVENFVENTVSPTLLQTVISQFTTHRFEEHFLVDSVYINVTRKGLSGILGDVAEILRLMELANVADKQIGQETWYAIRDDMARRADIHVTPQAAQRFLSLLSHPTRLGKLLRRLHELRVLEKLVVGLDHARHLVQFNEIHRYTIDEHCILAVEKATEFSGASGPLGLAYRSIPNPAVIHLALLIHDLGKGFSEDHSEVGRRLALETAARLNLDAADTQLLLFLVHKHLVMAHLAFRRDISDVSVVVKFAAEVGSPEYLRALYVLTAADLGSVGPGVLTPWKLEVLTELFLRTQNFLAGGHEFSGEQADEVRRVVLGQCPEDDPRWYEVQIRSMPDSYILENTAADIATDLQQLRHLVRKPVLAWGRFVSERQVSVYSLGFRAGRSRGTFHRIAAAFSRLGMNILSASLFSLANQSVLARIYADDPDFPDQPPASRFQEVADQLTAAIEQTESDKPAFRTRWQDAWRKKSHGRRVLPTRVIVDQSSHPDYTILDIFAHDRVGLLYLITRTFFDFQLLVHFAKITTHLDQVLSVFYLTNSHRQKIQDDSFWAEVRGRLLAHIDMEARDDGVQV